MSFSKHNKLDTNIGICRLCGKQARLLESHIIPNAFFSRILKKNEGKGIVIPTEIDKPIHHSSESWHEKLLCEKCERYLNENFEYYSIQLLRGNGVTIHRNKNGIIIDRMDGTKFRLFVISIVWRAFHSTLTAYDQVKITFEQSEIFRHSLLLNEDIPQDIAEIKLNRLHDHDQEHGFDRATIRQLIISPFARRYKNKQVFVFIFEGFVIQIKIPGAHINRHKMTSGTIPSGQNQRVHIPNKQFSDIPELMNTLVRGYDKYRRGLTTIK